MVVLVGFAVISLLLGLAVLTNTGKIFDRWSSLSAVKFDPLGKFGRTMRLVMGAILVAQGVAMAGYALAG